MNYLNSFIGFLRELAQPIWLVIVGVLGSLLVIAPFLQNSVNLAKEWWLVLFVGLGILAWLWKTISEQKIRYKKDLTSLVLGVGLIVLGVGTFFAESPLQSLLGAGNTPHSFLNFFLFAVLFFLVVNNYRKKASVAFYWGIIGTGLVLAIWGLISTLSPELGLSQDGLLLPASSIQTLVVWMGFPILLVISNYVFRFFYRGTVGEVISVLSLIASFALAFLVNVQALWVALFGGLLGVLALVIFRKETRPMEVVGVGILLLAVAAMILGGSTINFGLETSTPAQVLPTHSSSWNVAQQSLSSSPFWGAGLGSFDNQYLLHRSQNLNQTPFWSIGFEHGSSGLLTFLTEAGYLGTGLFLAFFGLLLFLGWIGGRRSWLWFLAVLYLGVLWFAYPPFLVHYILWFASAGFLASRLPGKVVNFSELRPQMVNAWYAGALAIVIVVVLGIFSVTAQATASYYIQEGRNASQLEVKQESFSRAASLDPASGLSRRLASEVYRQQLIAFLQENNQQNNDSSPTRDAEQGQEQQNRLTELSNQAISWARRALQVKQSADNWQQLGQVYETLLSTSTDAGTRALDAYTQAQRFHPASPALATRRSRVSLQLARQTNTRIQVLQQSQPQEEQDVENSIQQLRQARQQALNQALSLVDQALQLKSDYGPAHFLLVQVRDERGEIDRAIDQAQRLAQAGSDNAGSWFQLGFLQFKKGNNEGAVNALERAVEINNNMGNARYLLGLAYSNLEQPQKALEQFRVLARENPDNQEFARIVSNLENDQPILQGVAPSDQALQERPEAPVKTNEQQASQQ